MSEINIAVVEAWWAQTWGNPWWQGFIVAIGCVLALEVAGNVVLLGVRARRRRLPGSLSGPMRRRQQRIMREAARGRA